MDLQRLRTETAADHERTEATVPLMAEGLTRAAYAEVLRRMYGFVRGWELWADSHAPEDLRGMLLARQRSGLIAQDLAFLDVTLPERVAEFGASGAVTRASFLGSMYVIEGSTLGGQYIAAHAEKVLSLRPGEGDAYFTGYGARTGSMWNGFKDLLRELPDADADEVIRSAKWMFAGFEQWMTGPGGGSGEPRTDSEQDMHA